MIKVRRPRAPRELARPILEVKTERTEALKFHAKKANLKKEFPFKVYKQTYVKDPMEKAFHKKCAYCESLYQALIPVDVEHFRPKGAVIVNGKPTKPAYYWLASEWNNLLPSCIRCNRANKYKMRNKSVTMGKKNFFPLEDGSPRAMKPGEEKKEKPLLLDPCVDNPRKHLDFSDDGVVRSVETARGVVSSKGEQSIVIYALSRPSLVERRATLAKRIKAQIERVKEAIRNMQKYPNDPQFKVVLRRELKDLKEFRKPNKEYTAMARQLTDEFLTSMK
jgi:uncharacterized protein (TIGR02646 family)